MPEIARPPAVVARPALCGLLPRARETTSVLCVFAVVGTDGRSRKPIPIAFSTCLRTPDPESTDLDPDQATGLESRREADMRCNAKASYINECACTMLFSYL